MNSKQCSMCHKNKNYKYFYYQNKRFNKYMSACKECINNIRKLERQNSKRLRLRRILTKSFLKQKYIIERMSTVQIGLIVDCYHSTIGKYLKKYNIKLRDFKGKNHSNYKDGRTIKNYYCIDCGKKVSLYKYKRCQKCHYLFYKGQNVHSYKPQKHKCIDCKKYVKNQRKRCNICNKKFLKSKTGAKNSNWKNGISKLPYSFRWNDNLREKIRLRDSRKCQLCFILEKLHIERYKKRLAVHHIDYNKQNCNENNLITLCSKCNNHVNGNRDYWYAYFNYIMENFYENQR